MAALNLFRSCTTSLSSRSLSRVALSRVSLAGVRHYSDDKATPEVTAGGKEEVKEDATEEAPLSPELQKLKAKEAEVVDLTGRLRYLQADFLNLQRNAAREKEQTRDFAITRFATDLLETVDVLSMALKSVPPSALESPEKPDESATPPEPAPEGSPPPPKTASQYLNELYTGVEITQRQLLQTLFKYHVKPFDPTGDKFDPNRHEALYQVPIPGKEPGTVIDCQKLGYTIKDRVLRAAQVGVAQDTQS